MENQNHQNTHKATIFFLQIILHTPHNIKICNYKQKETIFKAKFEKKFQISLKLGSFTESVNKMFEINHQPL